MIWFALGKWNSASGAFFVRDRIRRKGYVWTPFVRLRWRYGSFWKGFCFWVAWYLPERVVSGCVSRAFVFATCGHFGDTDVTELTAMEMLKRWDEKSSVRADAILMKK